MTNLFNEQDYTPGERVQVVSQGFTLNATFVAWKNRTHRMAEITLDSGLRKTVRREEFREAQCERSE